MRYYSTSGRAPLATLERAVLRGLAEDRGLYMPERVEPLPASFFSELPSMSLQDIACRVARAFFGEDVDGPTLDALTRDALSFDIPLVPVEEGIYSLELFHGPTLAFKDVGARFMARLLGHFTRGRGLGLVHVLVATSGDTGSAVANGFLGVPGARVHVLYPKGKVSPIQECQFTTLGRNVTALEVDGSFDDCQALVKSAFMDPAVTERMTLTSANSINVARFLPQSFYYFHAVARLMRLSPGAPVVACVPSGNFGNLCSALFAKRMGLPVARFIAANNANDVFLSYLRTGRYEPRPSVPTIANAMDVGDPSNFARILDLYGGSHEAILGDISGAACDDAQIGDTMRSCLARTGYQLDPHGACAYRALREGLRPGEAGFFLETAHPAKFKQTVDRICGTDIAVPERLAAFMSGRKRTVGLGRDYEGFRAYLLSAR